MIDVVNNTLLLTWSKPKFVHQCQVDTKCRFAHPTSLWREIPAFQTWLFSCIALQPCLSEVGILVYLCGCGRVFSTYRRRIWYREDHQSI